ncbi:MAG: flagellar filament capping protein FliD [Planctomycetes bacterium]|nr:flagellar filament capping protein FliD [Planctomycetota bacterium]
MSSAGISFGGLASGLDTKSIISALVSIERRPISQLETKKSSLNKQKSLYSDLRGLLDKLRTSAKDLKATTDFLSMKAASDDEDVLKATASNSAEPGTYKVRVLQLAQAQVNASTGSASPTANLGGPASLILDVGGNQQLIAVNDPSLDSIAAAINQADEDLDTGVRAEVVDTGNPANGGAQRYQLVVRSTKPGSDGAFTLSVDDGEPSFQALINQVAGNTISQAQNAQLLVNGTPAGTGGITVYRSSNTIADLFPGITLDLQSVPSPNKDVTVTVTTDAEATSKKVQSFVDAYNKVVDFFVEQNVLDAEGKAKGPLFGDSTLRSMRSTLRGIVGASVGDTGNEAYQLLAQIGVTADTAGKLTFTKTKFEEALAADEDAVSALFTNTTSGLANRLIGQLESYTDTVDGLIKNRSDAFDRQVKDTQSRIDQAERRVTLYQQQLETRYANLESLLTRLQGQGTSLSSLNNLNR